MKKKTISLSVSHGDYLACIDVPSDFFTENTSLIINTLKECLNAFTDNKANKTVKTENNKLTIPTPSNSEFKVRDRLPNNIVDIKDLSVNQAVTEEALVRCPKCGQSHVLAVKSGSSIYVMRKFYAHSSKDEFRLVAELSSTNISELLNMSCKENTDKKAYFEDIQNMKMINDKDFVVNNDTEIFCPVCCKSDTFLEWKEAYDNPLKYFETEHLCDACGGEMIAKIIKEEKRYVCESCGHETEYNEG